MTRRRTLRPRDQAVSSFSATLLRLCDATGAAGATLVDGQGETVDYAGYLEPYALKVMAAEWRIVLEYVRHGKRRDFSDVQEFVVRAREKSFALVALSEGYALVLELPRGAFSFSRRAVAEAVRELELEAGLPSSNAMGDSERWSKLEVRTVPGDKRRPEAIWFKGAWHSVTIVGRYALPGATKITGRPGGGSPARSGAIGAQMTAYRARLATGHEFALVREPMGRWFAGDLSGFEPVPR
jgi:hypothetical protein